MCVPTPGSWALSWCVPATRGSSGTPPQGRAAPASSLQPRRTGPPRRRTKTGQPQSEHPFPSQTSAGILTLISRITLYLVMLIIGWKSRPLRRSQCNCILKVADFLKRLVTANLTHAWWYNMSPLTVTFWYWTFVQWQDVTCTIICLKHLKGNYNFQYNVKK